MIIDCISDLHGYYPKLEGGDLLIIAGDLTARDLEDQYYEFNSWLCDQEYNKKIVIAGNHDGLLEKDAFQYLEGFPAFEYLQDSGCEYKGIKIWGSPWTPTFCNWHFMKDRGAAIKEKWDLIPDDIDILVTHGPPYGVLDRVSVSSRGNKHGFSGCEELRIAVERIQPRLHVFGHIHEGYGECILKCTPRDILCVNCSIMDHNYNPVNNPIRIIL